MRTLFVLGAGSSCPFGMPSGSELRTLIIDICKNEFLELHRCFSSNRELHSVTPDQIQDFGNRFKWSHCPSIDQFLEINKSDNTLGKALIAACLLPRQYKAIFQDNIASDWLMWLFTHIRRPENTFANGDISFVTFNYDLILESSIYLMLKYRRRQTHEEAVNLLNQTSITHVYGSLKTPYCEELRDIQMFRQPITRDIYRQCPRYGTDIHLVHDREKLQDSILQSRNLVNTADKIIILGFGYNADNMNRIGLHGITSRRKYDVSVYASTFGLLAGEVERLQRLLGGSIGGLLHVGLPTHSCTDFLRNHCASWFTQLYLES